MIKGIWSCFKELLSMSAIVAGVYYGAWAYNVVVFYVWLIFFINFIAILASMSDELISKVSMDILKKSDCRQFVLTFTSLCLLISCFAIVANGNWFIATLLLFAGSFGLFGTTLRKSEINRRKQTGEEKNG